MIALTLQEEGARPSWPVLSDHVVGQRSLRHSPACPAHGKPVSEAAAHIQRRLGRRSSRTMGTEHFRNIESPT